MKGLQNLNWSNAEKIVRFLNLHQEEVAPYVKSILLTEDTGWRYWMLNELVLKWPKNIAKMVKEELALIAEKFDVHEETDLKAIEILLSKGMLDWVDFRPWLLAKEKQVQNTLSKFKKEHIDKFKELDELRFQRIGDDFLQFLKEHEEEFSMKYQYEIFSYYLNTLTKLKADFGNS